MLGPLAFAGCVIAPNRRQGAPEDTSGTRRASFSLNPWQAHVSRMALLWIVVYEIYPGYIYVYMNTVARVSVCCSFLLWRDYYHTDPLPSLMAHWRKHILEWWQTELAPVIFPVLFSPSFCKNRNALWINCVDMTAIKRVQACCRALPSISAGEFGHLYRSLTVDPWKKYARCVSTCCLLSRGGFKPGSRALKRTRTVEHRAVIWLRLFRRSGSVSVR